MKIGLWVTVLMAIVAAGTTLSFAAAETPSKPVTFTFVRHPDQVEIKLGSQSVATYVVRSTRISRPHFVHLKTAAGLQVTRNDPPVEGRDPTDHAEMHPGLWLAFGDLAGADFWRNKGPRIQHERFVQEPQTTPEGGSFAVANRYVADGRTLCRETTRYRFVTRPNGWLLCWDTLLETTEPGIYFGDQEEMGLGVRVASPLRVKGGNGTITNSLGGNNEAGTWGKPAAWCDYTGTVNDRRVGITLMSASSNERQPWFHTRDYGLMVANPFGKNASAPEQLPLAPGKPVRLSFGVLIHEAPSAEVPNLAAEYEHFDRLAR
jgi:hypothetical protein